MEPHHHGGQPAKPAKRDAGSSGPGLFVRVGWGLVAALPLVGFVSLLLRSSLDPDWDDYRVHFVLFLSVGVAASLLAYAAGEAAERRGDARVLLLSMAFLATGLFLGLHAVGTPGVLVSEELSGFTVAIPVGLLFGAVFAVASAFVDTSTRFAGLVISHRRALRRALLGAVAVWCLWTLLALPPLSHPSSEGSAVSLLGAMAALGALLYATSAVRYWRVYRSDLQLLPASIIGCFVLLCEALIGVAATGERTWHASWWEWHGLIITAYVVVFLAARREWKDERFRQLYLSTTRERGEQVSVLFADLAGFTTFTEQSSPDRVAEMLHEYYEIAAPLISRRFGGEVEKFIGDAIMATFNTRGDQPDHAVRAAAAALALQEQHARLLADHHDWPAMRVGVNTGDAVVREMGGHGYVAYAVVGDTINTGSRLEGQAPLGGVLIGPETYQQLPDTAVAEERPGLMVKGKERALTAYVLHRL